MAPRSRSCPTRLLAMLTGVAALSAPPRLSAQARLVALLGPVLYQALVAAADGSVTLG